METLICFERNLGQLGACAICCCSKDASGSSIFFSWRVPLKRDVGMRLGYSRDV